MKCRIERNFIGQGAHPEKMPWMTYAAGQIVDIPTKLAAAWIAQGLVSRVGARGKKNRERAEIRPTELAVAE